MNKGRIQFDQYFHFEDLAVQDNQHFRNEKSYLFVANYLIFTARRANQCYCVTDAPSLKCHVIGLKLLALRDRAYKIARPSKKDNRLVAKRSFSGAEFISPAERQISSSSFSRKTSHGEEKKDIMFENTQAAIDIL